MPRISKTKGIHPRHKVLNHVNGYERTMGNLLSHIKPSNAVDGREIRAALRIANNAVFDYFREAMRPLDPGKEADREAKEQYNDSVSAMRTAQNRFTKRINTWGIYAQE